MDEIRIGALDLAVAEAGSSPREDTLTQPSSRAEPPVAPVLPDARPPETGQPVDLLGQSKLFDLGQIDVQWEPELNTLWAFITPLDRPNYNLGLLRDTMTWQMEAKKVFAGNPDDLRYMVLGSRFPGVFNLGGDLEMFARCIENQDRETLRQYSHLCVDIVDRVWNCNDMPVINIGLAQGDALGGGFEALMCFDVIIAERQARFGLPEVLFGLFPGMGAYSILARKLGHVVAERMILSGKVYSAEEMHEMGVISVLADPGKGEDVAREYIASNRERHAGQLGVFRAGRRVSAGTGGTARYCRWLGRYRDEADRAGLEDDAQAGERTNAPAPALTNPDALIIRWRGGAL